MSDLRFTGETLMHVPSSYAWISTKRFDFPAALVDDQLLGALISHAQYTDTYAGGAVDESAPGPNHGPYVLDAISVSTFIRTTARDARQQLSDWAQRCAVEGRPATQTELNAFLSHGLPMALGDPEAVVYELPDLRSVAEHDWGWVVGQDGFHEFIVIDRTTLTLGLIVASDD
jgi:hypothetical protein